MSYHPYNWKPPFLAALRHMPVVTHACEIVDIERSTAYRARDADPEFATAWDDAMESGIDRAEKAAMQRAVDGWEEAVVDKGRLAYRYERVVTKETHADTGEEVEAETWRMVLDDKGQPIPLTVRKHSDALLVKVLSARRAAYRTERTEITGADGAPVAIDQTARAARVANLLALAQTRKDFSDLA